MRWVRIGIVAAFLAAAAGAGLAGSLARPETAPQPGAAPTAPSAPPELSATAEIRRPFMDQRAVAIAVTNAGDAPVHVVGVELVSESFAPLGVQEFDANIPPSENPRDLLTEYGRARCPDGVDSTAAPSSVVLDVETEDGAAHQVTAELPYPNGTLDRLLQEDCAAQEVLAAADIALSALTEAADGTVEGAVVLEPIAGAAIGVTRVQGSVLFRIAAPDLDAGPVTGAPGEAVTVPMTFDAFRCEGHAVGDAKQPFGFTMWITIDGADPIATPIEVPAAEQDRLWSMLDYRCGRTTD